MRAPPAFHQIFIRLTVVFLVCAFGGPQAAFARKAYDSYLMGSPTDVQCPVPRTPSLVLMGGAVDVDEAFQWMISKACGGKGGNFVVIRARYEGDYHAKIYAMGGIDSVETIIIPSREAAHDPEVIARIRGAEALFIAGGDQSDYINYWQDTPVETAIQELAGRNAPLGGTSAGLAVMGQYLFTALNGTISSSDALANPFDKSIALGRDFLALQSMGGVITESHFSSRDRMGRLITFMGRIVHDGWVDAVRSVAMDAGTALLVANGVAALKHAKTTEGTLYTGSAYFLQSVGAPQMYPKIPLTYANVNVQRLSAEDGTFDLRRWIGIYTTGYSISVINGVLYSTQDNGAIY